MENSSKKQRALIHKRNWEIPLILGGILFFSCIGFVLATERLNLNLHARVLVAYWCVVFVFVALLCTYLIENDFSRQTKSREFEQNNVAKSQNLQLMISIQTITGFHFIEGNLKVLEPTKGRGRLYAGKLALLHDP